METKREPIGVNVNEARCLDGILPEFIDRSTPLLGREVSLVADAVTKKLQLEEGGSVTDAVEGDPDLGSVFEIELVKGEVHAPILEITGSLGPAGGRIEGDGTSDFLDLRLDLDGILAYANVIPPLGLGIDFGDVADGSVDLRNARAGPSIDVFATFTLTPELGVALGLDTPVEVESLGAVNRWEGLRKDLPVLGITEATPVTPTFYLDAILSSETGLQFGLAVDLENLAGSLTPAAGGIDFFRGEFGPLFDNADDNELTSDAARVTLFDDSVGLGGFATVQGAPFRLAAATIPRPGAAWPLLGAFGVLGAAGRARRPA